MPKGSIYAQQIIITQAGTMKLGLSSESFRVIRGRVNRVSLYLSLIIPQTMKMMHPAHPI